MTQLNFQISKEINDFLEEMGEHEGISKSAYAKQKFIKIMSKEMMPKLADLYKKGEISIKKIARITNIHHSQVIKQIATLINDIDINDRVMEYSESVSDEVSSRFENKIKFDDSIL